MTSEIHHLLDEHLTVLTAVGSSIAAELLVPDSAGEVRRLLEEAGCYPRPEVVDFFTWRGYSPFQPSARSSGLFRHTPFPLAVADAIGVQRVYQAQRAGFLGHEYPHDVDPDEVFPGPDHHLPLAASFGHELLSVDCRPDPDGGHVELWSIVGDSKRAFSSLAEAISTATYCLEAGIWELNEYDEITLNHVALDHSLDAINMHDLLATQIRNRRLRRSARPQEE